MTKKTDDDTGRGKSLNHQMLILDAALDAILVMRETPDIPADLSKIPIGAISLLRDMGTIQVLQSGDQVFAIAKPQNKARG